MFNINSTFFLFEDYPNIQKIFEQCSNLIKNKYNFPFDLSFHFYLYPSFRLTSVAFSFCFIVLKKDKLLYIITEISSMLIKMLILLDYFILDMKIRSMPKIDMKSEENEIKEFYEEYEQFKKSFQFTVIVFICTLFLIFEILLFLLVMFINREYTIKDEVKTNKYQSIILYSFFGFTLFIMINFNGKECEHNYHSNFFPDSYRENRSFTNTNNNNNDILRYLQYNDSYFDENETIYIIYEYNYTDYPILKEIYEIYYPNDKKKIYEDYTTIYDSNIFNIFRFCLLPFVTFFAYCFLFCYKCKNKCKIVFIILEICSLIIKLITISLTYIITKVYAKKQNLKTEFKEIEYIINDYNEYAKCVNQCNVVIIEILFVIIEIIIFFYSLKNYDNSNINPNRNNEINSNRNNEINPNRINEIDTNNIYENKINNNINEDEISIINEKKKFDRYNLCQREAKIISDCGDKGSKNNPTLNLYFMMRTHYNKIGHTALLRLADHLMIIYLKDKSLYWKIFFDIFEFCKLISIDVFRPIIDFDKFHMKIYNNFIDSNVDLNFNTIEYESPNTKRKMTITNCRSFCMLAVMSFYYKLAYKFGFNPNTKNLINYKDDNIINYLDEKIISCLGRDNQYRAIKGLHLDEPISFDVSCLLNYNHEEIEYNLNDSINVKKDYYEELILFQKKYNLKELDIKADITDINVRYSNIYNLFGALSELIYVSSANTIDSIQILDKVKDLFIQAKIIMNDNEKLTEENKKYEQQLQEQKTKYENKYNTDINKLSKELEELKQLLQSKNDTINDLVNKNKELNQSLSNIYADDNIEDIDDTIERETSISDMISQLNDFNIVFIGGRYELLSKLNEYGWTNIRQLSSLDVSTGVVSIAAHADFCIINTRFISHALVYKIESITDPKRRMSYSGTNLDKLINCTYDFVMRYLNN